MQNTGIGRSLQLGIFLLLLAAYLTSQAQNSFEWRDASGNTRNLFDLEEILLKNRNWVDSDRKSGTEADLSGAYLDRAPLINAPLSEAQLSYAHLSGANLTFANLMNANLTGAYWAARTWPART